MLRSVQALLLAAVLVGCALFALPGTAWSDEPQWVLVDENEDSTFYYDQHGVGQPKEGMVQVNTRVVYTGQGKSEALKILEADQSKKFEKLSETRYLHVIDCKTVQSRLLEARHLDVHGAIIKATDLSGSTEWEEIPPYARMGMMLEKVCTEVPAR